MNFWLKHTRPFNDSVYNEFLNITIAFWLGMENAVLLLFCGLLLPLYECKNKKVFNHFQNEKKVPIHIWYHMVMFKTSEKTSICAANMQTTNVVQTTSPQSSSGSIRNRYPRKRTSIGSLIGRMTVDSGPSLIAPTTVRTSY